MFNNSSSAINATDQAPTPPPSDHVHFIIEMCITWTFVPIGIIGNVMVIVMLVAKRKQTRSLTNNDVLLLHLAWADFLYICFNTVMYTYHLKYFQPHMKTLLYCVMFYPLVSVIYTAGVFMLAALAVYRCWVITNPFKPKLKQMWIHLYILAIWLSALGLFLPHSITRTNKGIECPPSGLYEMDWTAYGWIVFTVQYPLPLMVMIVFYILIGLYLRKPRVPRTSFIARGNTIQRDETDKESIALAKTVALIVLLFAVLLLPLQIGMLATVAFKEDWGGYVWSYGDRLAMVNSALNPFLYTIRTPQYRKMMSTLLRRRNRSGSDLMFTENKTRTLSFTPSCATMEMAGNGERHEQNGNTMQMEEIDVKL